MNDAEAGGCPGDPGAVVAAELAKVVADGVEDPVARLVEVGDHHRGGGLVEVFPPGGADSDADRAYPLVDAGRALEPVQRGRQMIADRIGDVEHPKPMLRQRRPELLYAGFDGGFAARPTGMGVMKSRHPLRPGAMSR